MLQTLPIAFRGCKIILPKSTADFRYLRRYILAYDGDLLPEYDVHVATHIVATDSSQVGPPPTTTHVDKVCLFWSEQ